MSLFGDPAPTFINTSKATSTRLQTGGIYVAVVTRLTETGKVYVLVPKLGGDDEYGPCLVVGVVPIVDDYVLVAFLDNKLNELVCLGTFSQHPLSSESPTMTGTVSAVNISASGTVSASTFSGELERVWTIVSNPASSLTLNLTHKSNIVECSHATAATVTVPAESTVNYPIGTEIKIVSVGTGTVSVARASTSVNINGSTSTSSVFRLTAQWSIVTLVKRASNAWHVSGNYSIV